MAENLQVQLETESIKNKDLDGQVRQKQIDRMKVSTGVLVETIATTSKHRNSECLGRETRGEWLRIPASTSSRRTSRSSTRQRSSQWTFTQSSATGRIPLNVDLCIRSFLCLAVGWREAIRQSSFGDRTFGDSCQRNRSFESFGRSHSISTLGGHLSNGTRHAECQSNDVSGNQSDGFETKTSGLLIDTRRPWLSF